MNAMASPPQTRRLYQAWKGSNKFFCGGRMVFGPDVSSLFLSIVLIASPALLFCYQVVLKILKHEVDNRDGIIVPRHVLGLPVLIVTMVVMLLDLAFLILTSSRDPGIIPRNAHPPDSDEVLDITTPSMEWINGRTPHLRLPRTKDVDVNGFTVKVKYCDTCLLYRPPRASHCSICNNCVQKFDHHCPWVGQCIGLRNYRFFFLFISTSTFLCIYVFAFSWLNILEDKRLSNKSLWKCMTGEILSLVLVVYTFVVVWFVGGLTVFHIYLMSTNQTTYENFRYRYDKTENPFNKGLWRNIRDVFFTKIPPSMNDFRSWIQEKTEEIGSFTPNMGMNAVSSKEKFDIEMGSKLTSGGNIPMPSILQNLEYSSIDLSFDQKGWKMDNSNDHFAFPVIQEPAVLQPRDCDKSGEGAEEQVEDESSDKEDLMLFDKRDDEGSFSSDASAPINQDVHIQKT